MPEPLLNKEELILQFIDEELDVTERLFVENKIETDPEWKSTYERFATTVKAIDYYGITSEVSTIRLQLERNKVLPQIQQTKTVSINRTVRIISSVAASVILIVAGIVGYLFYQLSPDKVYQQNFVTYQTSITRGANHTVVSTIKQQYNKNKFDAVIRSSKNEKNLATEDAFLVGLACLQTNNASAAVQWLYPISNSQSVYKQDAEFYLALAYIKNKDYDNALQLMEKIKQEPKHLYNQQFSQYATKEVKLLKWK